MPVTHATTLDIVRERLPDLDTAIQRANVRDKDDPFDARCSRRMGAFLTASRVHEVGSELREGIDPAQYDAKVTPWTPEAVADMIASDVAFAFEKALNQRGISAGMMHNVCMMWARVLVISIDETDYAQYGLPGIKALAIALNLPNPIGDDYGNESKYAG